MPGAPPYTSRQRGKKTDMSEKDVAEGLGPEAEDATAGNEEEASSRASTTVEVADTARTAGGAEPPEAATERAAMASVAAAGVTGPGAGGKEEEHTDYLTGLRLACAMAALSAATFLVMLDTSILSTATPTITNEFHSVQDIGWYVSSYQLALSALQPLTGKFFTYFKNKWTYLVFIILFELGSLICGLATSSNMLIAGRAVSGLGASGIFNGGLTIVAGLVPLQKQPAMIGVIMGISQLGLIGGPLIGGSLTQYTTWRWCFFVNLPIGGLAGLILTLVHIPEQVRKPALGAVLADRRILQKFDVLGSAILVPAIVQLLLALQYGGNQFAWGSATVVGLFCGFAGTAAVFVWWEHRAGEHAMIPLRLFKRLVVVAAASTGACLFGVTLTASYFIPIFFQSILGDTPFESGVHMLPSILSQLVTAVFSGFMVSKLGYYLPWAVGSGTLTSIGAGLISTWSPTTSTGRWIGYQIIFGAGRGPGMQMGIIALQTTLPKSQQATGLAVLVFIQSLGAAILTTIANTIFDNSLVSQIGTQAPGVDAGAVLGAGATAFRKIVTPEQLPGVLEAFAISFRHTFYLAVGLAFGMFVAAFGLGWYDVRKKDPVGDRDREKKAGVVGGEAPV